METYVHLYKIISKKITTNIKRGSIVQYLWVEERRFIIDLSLSYLFEFTFFLMNLLYNIAALWQNSTVHKDVTIWIKYYLSVEFHKSKVANAFEYIFCSYACSPTFVKWSVSWLRNMFFVSSHTTHLIFCMVVA